MRIMTVRQPWATAIIFGGKDVENRTRNIAGAYRGPVLIHAGLQFDTHASFTDEQFEGIRGRTNHLGMIIGVVELTDSHPTRHPSRCLHDGKLCSSWAEESSPHHLVLASPRALDQPIPWKGGLGLREVRSLMTTGDWLAEHFSGCTCGTGGTPQGHEPACGWEAVARLEATS